jgi:hypothetical protein
VLIVALSAVFGVGAKIDHHPAVGGEIRISVGNQFVPVHFQFIPALASGHAPLTADASEGISQFGVAVRLPESLANRYNCRRHRGSGQ